MPTKKSLDSNCSPKYVDNNMDLCHGTIKDGYSEIGAHVRSVSVI